MELFNKNEARTATYTDEALTIDRELVKKFLEIAEQLDNPRELYALVCGAATEAVSRICLERGSAAWKQRKANGTNTTRQS